MRKLFLLLALTLLTAPTGNSQSKKTGAVNEDVIAGKFALIFDLQNLDVEATKLDGSLARALAKAEIADAAWEVDRAWSKKLLREAYELTFPPAEERAKLRDKQAGAAPVVPTSSDLARDNLRSRILKITGRDKAFSDELASLGAQQLGRFEEHFRYTSLATRAASTGELEAASAYLLRAFEADPTQITAGLTVHNIAARDRVAADQLIIQYIERLRTFPISMANQTASRTYFVLGEMVSPNPNFSRQEVPPPGRAAVRAYVSYVIESMTALEQREPGSAIKLRYFLLLTWLPLKQHAPDLVGAFTQVEVLSRSPGDNSELPQMSRREASSEQYESQVKQALDSGKSDEMLINFAISRGDFNLARKLIDYCQIRIKKAQLAEMANMREAVSLAAKGETPEAEKLARQLKKAASILEVYQAIINRCVADKNSSCVTSSIDQALAQLKRAEDQALAPLSMTKLAITVTPINYMAALEVLDEAISIANRNNIDTGEGRMSLDVNAFRLLARKDEGRVRAAASSLKERLSRISALAAIYQWKAAEFSENTKNH
ncbi:MAG: hypothetical protein LC803_06055 [Acidobacteria bacterium]|nr:hypothetical protein [Acidobacteriota bacterium]